VGLLSRYTTRCLLLYTVRYLYKILARQIAKPKKKSPSPLPHSRMKHLCFTIFALKYVWGLRMRNDLHPWSPLACCCGAEAAPAFPRCRDHARKSSLFDTLKKRKILKYNKIIAIMWQPNNKKKLFIIKQKIFLIL
jgi:hypothetical protein